MNLVIHSKPREHRAMYDGNEYGPMPTEIQLVQELKQKGIDIKDFTCVKSDGYDNICVSIWERRL